MTEQNPNKIFTDSHEWNQRGGTLLLFAEKLRCMRTNPPREDPRIINLRNQLITDCTRAQLKQQDHFQLNVRSNEYKDVPIEMLVDTVKSLGLKFCDDAYISSAEFGITWWEKNTE